MNFQNDDKTLDQKWATPHVQQVLAKPELVHKILLSDDDELETLTWNSVGRAATVNFDEFVENWLLELNGSQNRTDGQLSIEDQIASTMRRAYLEKVRQSLRIEESIRYDLYKANVKEMNEMVRSLIPNRKDLHSLLSDPLVDENDMHSLLKPLKQIATALLRLEAPDRDWATREWLEKASKIQEEELVDFVVNSMAYLHHVVQQTHIDLSNAKLAQVAPIIRKQGVLFERSNFACKFQITSGVENLTIRLPHTTEWIGRTRASLASSSTSTNTLSLNILKTIGFVREWIFSPTPMAVPEVLEMDVGSLRRIRRMSQVVVAGTALTLHVGSKFITDEDRRRSYKTSLSHLLMSRGHPCLQMTDSQWKQAIVDLLIKYSNEDSGKEGQTSLHNRCQDVLDGTDPVLKLMDDRIRQYFIFSCDCIEDSCHGVPEHLQSGRSPIQSHCPLPFNSLLTRDLFVTQALERANQLKFGIFAEELAEIGYLAKKVTDLMCQIHGNILIRLINHINRS